MDTSAETHGLEFISAFCSVSYRSIPLGLVFLIFVSTDLILCAYYAVHILDYYRSESSLNEDLKNVR